MNKELMGTIYQSVIEVISWSTDIQFIISQLGEFIHINLIKTC